MDKNPPEADVTYPGTSWHVTTKSLTYQGSVL